MSGAVPEIRISPPEPKHEKRPSLPRCANCLNPPDKAHPELIEWDGKMYCKPHWIDLVIEFVQQNPEQMAKDMGLTVQMFSGEE